MGTLCVSKCACTTKILAEDLTLKIIDSITISRLSFNEFAEIALNFEEKIRVLTASSNRIDSASEASGHSTTLTLSIERKLSFNLIQIQESEIPRNDLSPRVLFPILKSPSLLRLEKKTNNCMSTKERNIKAHLSLLIQEHLLSKDLTFKPFNDAILPNLNKAALTDYKLLFLSWAIGFLTGQKSCSMQKISPKYVFLNFIYQVYGEKPTKSNIKEFIRSFLIYNIITFNREICKVYKKMLGTLVDGTYINIEFLQSFIDLSREVYNFRLLEAISLKFETVYDFDSENFQIKDEKLFSTLICTKTLREYIIRDFK